MRVALVSNSYWNLYNFRQPIARALRHAGYEVIFIAPKDAYMARLRAKGYACHALDMKQTSRNPLQDLYLWYRLLKTYRRLHLRLVLQYTIKLNIYGSLAAACLRIPSVCNVSGIGTAFMKRNWIQRVVKTLYRLAFVFPRHIFFQNEDDQASFTQWFGLTRTPTGLVPGSGVNTDQFKPRVSFVAPPPYRPCTFVMTARLLIDKGVREYAQAAACLRAENHPTRFILAGEYIPSHPRSVTKHDFERWVREGTIEYMGYVEDIAGLVAEADCVVLPSYREGTPRSLLEGAAMGKPLIATDVPGCRQVVRHKYNGFLCEPKQTQSLATAMEHFLRLSIQDRNTMGIHSRALACARFDERYVVDAYMQKVQELLPQ